MPGTQKNKSKRKKGKTPEEKQEELRQKEEEKQKKLAEAAKAAEAAAKRAGEHYLKEKQKKKQKEVEEAQRLIDARKSKKGKLPITPIKEKKRNDEDFGIIYEKNSKTKSLYQLYKWFIETQGIYLDSFADILISIFNKGGDFKNDPDVTERKDDEGLTNNPENDFGKFIISGSYPHYIKIEGYTTYHFFLTKEVNSYDHINPNSVKFVAYDKKNNRIIYLFDFDINEGIVNANSDENVENASSDENVENASSDENVENASSNGVREVFIDNFKKAVEDNYRTLNDAYVRQNELREQLKTPANFSGGKRRSKRKSRRKTKKTRRKSNRRRGRP